jgi:D-amino-acid dehydrogenase
MEIIVLGSGVIGLTSAWYLAQAGHEVTVIDRQSRSGEETSFANAGQISYGYSSPWAAPGIPKKAIKWLLQQHAPLKIKPSLSPELYKWASQMLLNCSNKRYQVNKSRMLSLSNYSQECLSLLRKEQQIRYEGRQQGTLQLFRTQQQLDGAQKDMRLLEMSGTKHALLDVNGCIKQEPGLANVANKLTGGLYLPEDETGDCFLFCQQLTELAMQAGVTFMFDTEVQSLVKNGDDICGVLTNRGTFSADSYVVAMGSYSTQMLAPLGIHIPVYPVKGYSLTVPINDSQQAPQSTVMDESYKVAMTRFDDRIRIAGTAELTGFDYSIPEKRKATIEMVVKDLFPQAGHFEQGEFWTGLRPMTPDGTPIIGKTHYKNLYTNTGHGTLGWTMACGSAQLLTDVIDNSESAINSQQFDLFRYFA